MQSLWLRREGIAHARSTPRPARPDYVYPGYSYAPWTELARLLASLAPRPLTTCFRATGGSEAVDLALQAAMIHTGRRALLSLEGSYHGNSLAGLSIGASDNREHIKNLLPHCGKIAPPLDAKALRRIEQRLKRRDVAAFVIEPISINLGVLIPEKDVIRRVRDLCRRYGTLFIADEVASGFGRTGRLFACEHFDLDPDMLCVAKAMSGGLAPIGAMIATAPRDLARPGAIKRPAEVTCQPTPCALCANQNIGGAPKRQKMNAEENYAEPSLGAAGGRSWRAGATEATTATKSFSTGIRHRCGLTTSTPIDSSGSLPVW